MPFLDLTANKVLRIVSKTEKGLNQINITVQDISDGKFDSTIFLKVGRSPFGLRKYSMAQRDFVQAGSLSFGVEWRPIGDWGPCSATCDGLQYREYGCVDAYDQQVRRPPQYCSRSHGIHRALLVPGGQFSVWEQAWSKT